jgi:AcrR family transcriptional regulator
VFDAEDILDTAVRLIARDGASAATASAVAREIGAPSGSIYHRFPSRDLLVARLWLRTVSRFQEGFEAALAIPDVEEAADAAATHTPRWCREHIDEACVLVLHRRRDLTTAWPDELGRELDELGERLGSAIRGFARRRFASANAMVLDHVRFALVDVPYAAVRRYIGDRQAPPAGVDRMILTACRAVLASTPRT